MSRCLAGGILGPASPPHDGRGLGKTAFDDLVPADHLLAVLVEEILHLMREPSLQLLFALQPLLAHPTLAVGTLLPVGLFHLVATDVHILIGEELEDLLIDILAELDGRVLARTGRRGEGGAPACIVGT